MSVYDRGLRRYPARNWNPAINLGAYIDTVEDLNDGPTFNVEVSGVPVGNARTINFVGGAAIDLGGFVINYTPPGAGSGTATDFQVLAADPGAPADGAVWYNSTTNLFKFQQNGVTTILGGAGGPATAFQIFAADPGAPADGDVWYNSTTNLFKFQQNGVPITLGGAGGTADSFQILVADPGAPVDGDVWYNSTTNLFKFQQNGVTTIIGSGAAAIQEDIAPFVGTVINIVASIVGLFTLYKNGVLQTVAGNDYTIAGQVVTLTVASIITDRFTAIIGVTNAGGSGTAPGDTIINQGDAINNNTSTTTNQAGSITTYDDNSIINNAGDTTYGATATNVYAASSTTTFQDASIINNSSDTTNTANSTTVFADNSVITNNGDTTYGPTATNNYQSGSVTDFNAGSVIDFTGATVTGLNVSSNTGLTQVSAAEVVPIGFGDSVQFSDTEVYTRENAVVRKYLAGVVTTLGTYSFAGSDLFVTPNGNVYTGANSSDRVLQKMTPAGVASVLYTSAGNSINVLGTDTNNNVYFRDNNLAPAAGNKRVDSSNAVITLTLPAGWTTVFSVLPFSAVKTYVLAQNAGVLAIGTIDAAGVITQLALLTGVVWVSSAAVDLVNDFVYVTTNGMLVKVSNAGVILEKIITTPNSLPATNIGGTFLYGTGVYYGLLSTDVTTKRTKTILGGVNASAYIFTKNYNTSFTRAYVNNASTLLEVIL